MKLEQSINYYLNRVPKIKKILKRVYQLTMYCFSAKLKFDGNIVCVSPKNSTEYFFGYYDKSPWDYTGRYLLCMEAINTSSEVAPKDPVKLLLIDSENHNKIKEIGISRSWNVQQGCMLQWLGPGFSDKVIFNDFRDGHFCSVIMNVRNMSEEKILKMPIYSVSSDGKTALTLDFSRLHRLRPGYGYSNIEEFSNDKKLPDSTCIWKINLETGEIKDILKYTDLAIFEPRKEMHYAEHKVNHIMISPNGKRFMFLHRWINGHRKYSRLITCDIDGSNMYNLSDDDMVSHCCWKNDTKILAFENKRSYGPGYYLMTDKTQEFIHLWPSINSDGHPSYCPIDKTLILTDSYPNRARIADIKLLRDTDPEGKEIKVIAKVFAPFKYDNDTRCDLHPRWRRDGKAICFDSVFEGNRGLYIVNFD